MRYTLFGATGTVGKAVASELSKAGQPFRVVGRSEERLKKDFSAYGADYCVADLNDPQQALHAANNTHTLLYLVGVPYTQFQLHPKLTRTALDAASNSGVRRFVLLSTVYPYGLPQQRLVDETHPRNPQTFKGQMRKQQEDLVQSADGKNGMRTTVLRPPDFYGPDSELSYARGIFDAALKGGRANVIGPVDTPHEFIYVPDVAKALLALSNKEEAYGQAWNIAGSGAITTRRFAELVFAAAGKKPKLLAANRTMLRLLGLFNPLMREVVEMHYLWTNPVLLDDTRLRRLLPELQKTPYEDGILATLQAMRAVKRQASPA